RISVAPLVVPRTRWSALSPSTTLFRPTGVHEVEADVEARSRQQKSRHELARGARIDRHLAAAHVAVPAHDEGEGPAPAVVDVDRSEEHTSELQSRENLVCRLLLEKENI